MRRLAWCLCLTLLIASGRAQAQDQQFERGIDARGDKRWRDVITQMTLAIQADPKESDRRVGRVAGGLFGRGTPYLPFYFLGEALFSDNDCASAVTAWERSEDQGVVQKHDDYMAQIRRGFEVCRSRGVLLRQEFGSETAAVNKLYAEANNFSGRIGARSQANPGLWRDDMRQEYERAGEDLRLAYAKLTTGAKSRLASDFGEARAAADRATKLLRTVDTALSAAIQTNRTTQQQADEVEKILTTAGGHARSLDSSKALWTEAHRTAIQAGLALLDQSRDRLESGRRASNAALIAEARTLALDGSARLNTVVGDLSRLERLDSERAMSEQLAIGHEIFSFIEGGFVTFNEFIKDRPELLTPEVIEERDRTQQDVNTARRRFESAQKSENLNAVREAIRLASIGRDRLNALISTFGPLTLRQRGVHEVLQEGVRLFFQGQYQAAVQALEAADGFGPEVPLQQHVHMVRAAALHALFVRSGEADLGLRARAMEEIARSRQLSPEIVPDERFSPRFIEFFESAAADARDQVAESRP